MKDLFKCDLHVHSNYSYDNPPHNTMEKNVVVAIERGIDVLCFTDHIEYSKINTFDNFPFDQRQREFDLLKEKYHGKIKLLLGFEMESPHHHPEILERLRKRNPDMIIGSVHFPTYYNGIGYNIPHKEYAHLYNQEVRKMVQFGGFDVLGHVDMPKKYQRDYRAENGFILETLEICAKKGIVPEMNTSSLRQTDTSPITQETMASADAIRHYAKHGGKYVTISSDSHLFETVGYAFEHTYQQIKDCVSLCYFEKGKLTKAR